MTHHISKKKRSIRAIRIVFLIIGVVSVVVFPPWNGIWAWLAPLPDTVQEQVDDAFSHGLDGVIVYVDQAEKTPVLYHSGWKDRVNKVPSNPNSLFKIGSISKLFIATAAAKLVNDQLLSLDDTLADHLPELVGKVKYADQITLMMMLNHRSGIANYTDHEKFDWSMPSSGINEVLELVTDMKSDFEPDTDYNYSNTNYLFIGEILDKILGYSHQRYIKEKILTPLNLNRTFGSLSQVDLEDVISGYHRPYEQDFKEVDFVNPGGSYIATAHDIGVFLRALNDGTLLNSSEQAIYASIYEYGHKGWVLGYQSIARYHADIDTVVIQFVNTTGKDTELTAVVVYERIVQILSRQ